MSEIDTEYTLDENIIGDQPPLRAGEIYAQYDAKRAEFVRDSQGLTLATLADMVLGEDATDRSDDALVRAVGMLMRERYRQDRSEIQKSLEIDLLMERLDTLLVSVNAAKNQMYVQMQRAEQAEAELGAAINQRNEAQRFVNENYDLIGYWRDLFKRANAAKRAERKCAEQAGADRMRLAYALDS